ncbi:glycosyltransferase [Opitutia bacterium ISCC 51]|nr:glycosyltransferase [Opitutae bacterium ISCC 51]QXD28220.1 glycosyltransferase [Opitutae bacterium ISCC 52]
MESQALKICDVVQFYSTLSGGVRRYVHEKIAYLLEHTPHSHCLVIPSHRNAITHEGRTSIYEIKSPKLIGSNSYRMLVGKKKILQAIAEEQPDVIEVGDPYRAAWIGLEAAKRNQIPIVAFYHSDYPRALDRTLRKYTGPYIESLVSPLIQRYLIKLYKRMSATVVSSKRCYKALDEIGIQNLRQIALGTNLKTFTPRDSRARICKEIGISTDTKLLLFVGRLAREKNIRSLFDMMEELKKRPEPHHLALLGDGEWRDEVRQKSREEKNISWMHFSDSPERLADFYSAADLFVHAGDCETFGLVSLEAQACGTRVLAIRGGGLDEGLKNESPLIMAKDTSGKALAEAVGEIWELEETEIERGLRRQNMEKTFSWNATFSKMTALYSELAQKHTLRENAAKIGKHEPEDSALFTQ